MKKWLDNYNDYNVSAPEGMEGDGYSNVGRNSSPAWGGQFQNGGTKKPITTREDFDPSVLSNIPGLTSLASGNQPGYNRQEQYGPLGDLYRYYGGQPLEHDVLVESQNKPSTYKDKNAKYISLNHDREFVNEVLDNYERVSSGKLDKGIESKLNDNSWSVSGYSSAGKDAHKTKKQGSEHHSNAIGRYTLGKGKDKKGEYISYYDKFDQGTGDDLNPGEALGITKPFEIYDRIYLKDVNRKYQMGGNLPGAVGNMYARTGSPSEGKYAKKTLPSAQNGLDSNTLPPPKSIGKPKDVRKKGDIMKLQSMYNTDEVNYVPTVESLKGLKNPNLSSIESAATNQFVDWYSNPETLKRTKAAGYDPARIKDFIAKGLKTPIKVNDKSSDFPMNPSGEGEYRSPYVSKQMEDPTHPDTGYIMYNPQVTDIETKSIIGHELSHAAGLDNLYAPSLYRALDLKLPEKYHSGLQYMDKPEEVYGNFQEMRLQMGLKPGQTIDYKTLNDKMGNDKIPNNFWRNFSADPKTGKPDPNRIKKIVKAINTVAQVDTPQQDRSIQTAQNGQEMQYYQQGLDWKPKSISRDGSVIKDDRGQWDYPGEITEISGDTMATHGYGDIPLYVVPDKGKPRMVQPNTGTQKFPGAKKFTEYPMAKNGVNQQDQKTLEQLDQLTNFTNYNKPQPGGWLNKYKS